MCILAFVLCITSKSLTKGESQMRHSLAYNILSIFNIFSSKILLQIAVAFLSYSVRAMWINGQFLSFQSINSSLLTNNSGKFVVLILFCVAFVELILCSISQSLFGHDLSICRKAVWSENFCFGPLMETLLEIYVQCDFILNSTVCITSNILTFRQQIIAALYSSFYGLVCLQCEYLMQKL